MDKKIGALAGNTPEEFRTHSCDKSFSQRPCGFSRRFDDLIQEAKIIIEPVTEVQARIAREAYRDFGKGSRHPAKLNFGDCFAYALARATGQPLLFKGDNSIHTDASPHLDDRPRRRRRRSIVPSAYINDFAAGSDHQLLAAIGYVAEDHAAPAARSAISLSSFDRTVFAEPSPNNRLQEVGRAPIGAPASTNAGTKTKSFRPGRLGNVASAPIPVNPGSHARLLEMKGGVCVSTVSIVCSRGGDLPDRARVDQILAIFVIADVGRLRRLF